MLFIMLIGFGFSVMMMFFMMTMLRKNPTPTLNAVFGQDRIEQPKKTIEITEEMVIRLAGHLGGRLSADDLVKQTSLNFEQAKNMLEKLAQKGICEIRLNEVQNSGKIYYYF